MRSHAKAPSAATTRRRAKGLGRLPGIAVVFAFALLALTAATASATTATHVYLEDFGSAAQPTFSEVTSLAVDQSSGDVVVLDAGTQTISRYHADGTPDDFSALGTNVIDGVGSGPPCTPPSVECDGTPEGGFGLGGAKEQQIAVDESGTATDGNIYLTEAPRGLIYVFGPTGEYLGKLTQYKEGADATGSLAPLGEACGVAVAPNGTVYVGDYSYGGLVHKYVPTGSTPVGADNVANFSYPEVCKVAAGTGATAGFVFADSYIGQLSKLDASTGAFKYVVQNNAGTVSVDAASGDLYVSYEEGFMHFDASGAKLIADVPGVEGRGGPVASATNGEVYLAEEGHSKLRVFSRLLVAAELAILPPREVTATKATLRGTVNPDGAAITACEFEYGTVESGAFSESVPCSESVPTDTETHTVSALASGLEAGVEYQYRLTVTNSDARTSTSAARTFRSLPRAFTGGPTDVLPGSATLNGLVRPEGEAVSECEFEYGADASYGQSVPCSPAAASIPTDFGAHGVSAQISGLEEFSVYHYRLTFTTAAGAFAGRDEVFRTLGPTGLPDNRRYEQVSPVDKNHSDIDLIANASMASLEGNGLVFRSTGSFAGAPTAQLSGVQYLARRGPGGWSTENITLPGGELGQGPGYEAFTPDLSKGVIKWSENTQTGPYDPSAQRGFNLYLHNAADGSFRLLNGTLAPVGFFFGQVVWASSDLSHLAIVSQTRLTPEAAGLECEHSSTPCAYEWDEGTLRLASIVNGVPVEGTPGDVSINNACGYEHAMSSDGSRLFFTSPPGFGKGGDIYAREDGATTTPISESERTLPGGLEGRDVNFQDAEAAHGDRVIFTTKNSLLDEDTNESNDLYLYDYSKPAGERLTLISKDEDPSAPEGASIDPGTVGIGDCGGVMGASEDLRRVYFVTQNQIVAGEPEEAGPKLFLWDGTGASPSVSYLGKLSAGDSEAWMGAPASAASETRKARVSSDGRYLAFLSTAKLSGFENEGAKEVYRYDAVSQTMECASCSPDAVPAEGPISLEFESDNHLGSAIYNHLSTNVTDSGQVFFDTTRGLIPADSNGQSDVYEYENGRLHLISSGEGPEGSFFLDATRSGSDVFFTTKDRLVGWDKDSNTDAYDAREGGGFPEPPLLPPDCNGDACQPAPNAPNDPTPASSSFEGAGNVTEPAKSRCAKGKVRRHGRCVKRRKHAKKHARHNRTATRSHG